MNHRQTDDSESRFAGYVEGLASVIGHKDREGPLRDYCTGLLMPCERKSVEPMAAITAPHRTAAQHQSLLHFIGEGKWSDEKVLAKVREMVVPQMQRYGAIEAWIIDDTGFPKQGQHSVGVARQYCGQLGKQDNCQVAVTLSLANHHASLPVAYQLYLPQDWAQDRKRRRKVGIPEVVEFKAKPEIALEQLRWAHEAGLPRGVALLDAGYGNNTALRDGITALEMPYAVGISATTTVWAPGTAPLPAKQRRSGRGRPAKRLRRDRKHRPLSVKALALRQPKSAWQTITWRGGTAAPLSSRFARLRVRPAHRDEKLTEPRPEEWLLIEWLEGEKEPTKYWLPCRKTSNLRCLWILPNCAGASNATIRNSSRRSGSAISKAADGAASTTTPRCASRLTASWSPSGRRFPPQDLVAPGCSKNLPFPPVTDPAAPPLRTERHIPNSIATMRRRLIIALAKHLGRCPCCQRAMPASSQQRNL